MSDSTREYWANAQGDVLCGHVRQRFREFEEDLWITGDYGRMEAFRLAYYGEAGDGSAGSTAYITPAGSDGQARNLRSNKLRAAVSNKLSIALADPPDAMPIPASMDTEAINQAKVAVAYVESRLEEGADAVLREVAEIGEGLGWGWLDVPWDDGLGDPLDATDSPGGERPVMGAQGLAVGVEKVRTGDLRFVPRLPVDVAFPLQSRNSSAPEWVVIQSWENKYTLAATYLAARPGDPDAEHMADRIRGLQPEEMHSQIRFGRYWTTRHTDEVQVWELRHVDTPACPGGRVVRMCGDSIMLPSPHLERAAQAGLLPRPDANPYGERMGEDLGIRLSKAELRIGTPRGYTDSHDCLGLQAAVDLLTSEAYSNQHAFGGNILFAQKGSGLTPEQLTEAITVVYLNDLKSQMPQVAQLLKTPPEIFEFRQTLIDEIGQMKGLNAVSQGTDTRDLSGAAFALLDTQTQRQVGRTARESWRVRQWVANTIVQQVQRFGRGTRKAVLKVGKAAKQVMSIGAAELRGLHRVEMARVSAVQRSPAGRMHMAETLLQSRGPDGKPNINAEQYVAVLTTGKLEPLTEGPAAVLSNIRSENERLGAGEVLDAPAPTGPTGQPLLGPDGRPLRPQAVTASAFDDHPLHMREHAVVLASPAARRNPDVVRAVAMHMQAHAALWRTTDPAVFLAMGVPLPPPPPGMLGPDGQPIAPQGGPAGVGIPPQASGVRSPGGGLPESDAGAPSMPSNPSTGEKWSPTGAVNG